MRVSTTISLVAALVVANADNAMACVCACKGEYAVERYISDAAVIIVGRVLEIADRKDEPDSDGFIVTTSCGEQWIRVAVIQRLKGEALPEMTFVRGEVGTDCDFKFTLRRGREYLLFGLPDRDGNALYLSGCSPSLPAYKARSMIKKLNAQIVRAR